MTPTPVGMRCPACARERTKVKTMRGRSSRWRGRSTAPVVTQALIAINVIVFVAATATGTPLGGASSGTVGTLYLKGALYGPYISILHEYYRLLTYGFLHDGILHIAFNMWFLFILGPMLETAIGRVNFTVVYVVSLLAGAFGALLLTPLDPTVGASGALFGILGALMVVAYYRGISIWQSGLALTLIINIVFSLTLAGISIGGHLGGFVGGAICGWLIVQVGERRNMQAVAIAGCIVVGVISVLAAVAVAGSHGLAPNGITI
ncbi:MAG TPA: rhomboid family intramembrane serine protease [Solirubrobacteraceae bacterium]|jgi:membrane associated rhomboid family serine protease|nr:rhomboid family intramembrane serine protease [Solirubrobacteraceae bacterium]